MILYSLSLIAVGIGISSVIFISKDPRQLYYTGLVLTILFTYTVSGLSLNYAVVSSVIISVLFISAALYFQSLSSKVIFNDVFGLISVNIIGGMAAYLLEKSRRKEFLYRLQSMKDRATLEEANRKLLHLSYHDRLTGLKNRRAFEEHVSTEWRRAQKHKYSVAFLMIDIDDFKKYNDAMGHLAGDEVLKRIGEVLIQKINRSEDLVARYGGEEFVVFLSGADKNKAVRKAQEIVSAVKALNISHPHSEKGIVTVSVGCTAVVPWESAHFQIFLQRADEALYQAKTQGKDGWRYLEG